MAPPPASMIAGAHGLAGVPDALDVDVDVAVPPGVVRREEVTEDADAGVAVEHVDVPVRVKRRLGEALAVLVAGHVAAHPERVEARVAQLLRERHHVLAPRREDYLGAMPREDAGDPLADSLGRPRDDGDLSLKLAHATSSFVGLPCHALHVLRAGELFQQGRGRARPDSRARCADRGCGNPGLARVAPIGVAAIVGSRQQGVSRHALRERGLWQTDCCHNPRSDNAGSGMIATTPIGATSEKNLAPQTPAGKGAPTARGPAMLPEGVSRRARLEEASRGLTARGKR